MEKEKLEELIYKVIGAMIEVHKQLGPGLLESVYHQSLEIELEIRKINVTIQRVFMLVARPSRSGRGDLKQ